MSSKKNLRWLIVPALLGVGACAGRAPAAPPAFPPPPAVAGEPVVRAPVGLLIPVAGIRPDQLSDTYDSPRSGGRTHLAIDIMAPRRTPVLAATDGTVLKLREGGLGGTTIYQLDDNGRTRYYYAHLDGYARGIKEGQRVWRGQVIGYVGATGNAAGGPYHLHFSIAVLHDLERYWEGINLNPYPLLAGRLANQ